jgi:hypothetical protein
MRLFVLLIPFFFLLSKPVLAQDISMRRCMVLPITDSIDGALAFRVQEVVEQGLKEGSWCYYKSNSEIMNILRNYKQNLHMHLQNRDVIKVLAKKLNAGSLIKADIKKEVNGATVSMEIIGSNGEDIYFKEKARVDSDDPEILGRTINNWLDLYDKQIPYDGRVLGVLGDQITIDIGKASHVRIGNNFRILRPKGKKKHPLLKEIVEWEFDEIAKGSIFNVSEFQAQGLVKVYLGKLKLGKGDWVRIEKIQNPNAVKKERFPEVKADDFGQLGKVNFWATIGNGSTSNLVNSNNLKIGGFTFGLGLGAEVWATRNYFMGLDVSREFGSYKQKVGTVSSGTNSVSLSQFKLYAGYKYLPLGYYYGPQIDGILGYANNKYSLDTSTTDSFGEASFKGLLLGVRGDAPILKDWRINLKLLLMFNPEYEEDVQIFGEEDSASGYEIEGGGTYAFSPAITVEGNINVRGNKAKFVGPTKELSHKNTTFKFGASFKF